MTSTGEWKSSHCVWKPIPAEPRVPYEGKRKPKNSKHLAEMWSTGLLPYPHSQETEYLFATDRKHLSKAIYPVGYQVAQAWTRSNSVKIQTDAAPWVSFVDNGPKMIAENCTPLCTRQVARRVFSGRMTRFELEGLQRKHPHYAKTKSTQWHPWQVRTGLPTTFSIPFLHY